MMPLPHAGVPPRYPVNGTGSTLSFDQRIQLHVFDIQVVTPTPSTQRLPRSSSSADEKAGIVSGFGMASNASFHICRIWAGMSSL